MICLYTDVTLPALFMPTSCTKNLVYTPRAHQYFHPPGSHETRITQPPAVFKLPTLHMGVRTSISFLSPGGPPTCTSLFPPPPRAPLSLLPPSLIPSLHNIIVTFLNYVTQNMGTLNLFELSQHFSRVGPQWLREQQFQSPHFTPAPPPSACGVYRQPPRINSTSSSANNIHGVSVQATNLLELGNNGGE